VVTLDDIQAALQDLEKVLSFDVGEKGKNLEYFTNKTRQSFHFIFFVFSYF
jgi:hypothetical protein